MIPKQKKNKQLAANRRSGIPSINQAISGDQCSVTYASVDNAVQLVQELGKGCLLANLDLKEAYRAVPVHPSDRRLLGVS